MKSFYLLKKGLITLIGLCFLGFPQANAQLGIGIGAFSGPGYYGPGYYGWPGFGSFFGIGLDLSARRYSRSSETRPPKLGTLEGNVNLCPAEQKKSNCAAPDTVLQNLVVSAMLYGSKQWISTRADGKGAYRLQLPPGRYLVRVDSPDTWKEVRPPAEVEIRSGRTRRLDLKLNSV